MNYVYIIVINLLTTLLISLIIGSLIFLYKLIIFYRDYQTLCKIRSLFLQTYNILLTSIGINRKIRLVDIISEIQEVINLYYKKPYDNCYHRHYNDYEDFKVPHINKFKFDDVVFKKNINKNKPPFKYGVETYLEKDMLVKPQKMKTRNYDNNKIELINNEDAKNINDGDIIKNIEK